MFRYITCSHVHRLLNHLISQVKRVKHCFRKSLYLVFFWYKIVQLHNFDHYIQNLFRITNIQMLKSTGVYSGQMKLSNACGSSQEGFFKWWLYIPSLRERKGNYFLELCTQVHQPNADKQEGKKKATPKLTNLP